MNRMIQIAVFCLSVWPVAIFAAGAEATVKLKVVDEAGNPVPEAKVWVTFEGMRDDLDREAEAKTDAKGQLEVKGWSKIEVLDAISVFSDTPGYYISRLKLPLMLVEDDPGSREFDLTMTLRKVGKPIPMHAKKVRIELPEQRKEIGFDFQKSDWVKPYGEGEVADCTFLGTKSFEDDDNYKISVVMAFPNKMSGLLPDPANMDKGLQSSTFKTTRMAPMRGYKDAIEFVALKTSENGYEGTTRKANYIFRSRVVLDERGNIKSCHYGKVIEARGSRFGAGKEESNPHVEFTYYFNPTPNDVNLEFDPKQNLFGELDWDEAVKEP